MNESKTVLFADPCAKTRESFAKLLRSRAFDVQTAGDLCSAEYTVKTRQPRFAIVEQSMTGKMWDRSGIEFVRAHAPKHDIGFVVHAAFPTIDAAIHAIKAHAVDYVAKPASIDELVQAIYGERSRDEPPSNVMSLERMQHEYMMRIYAEHGGNATRAATALRVPIRTMWRKLSCLPPRF